MAVAEGQRADGGEAFQGPVEEQGVEVGAAVPGGRGAAGGGSALGGCAARPVRHFAALLLELGDALGEEVQEGGYGDGARGELEEGEHLGHGLDGLGDRSGLDALGCGVDERPGVEERDPAAQHGGVVPVPGAQPPAGAGGVAVQFDEAGQPGPVPARTDLGRGELQGRRGPFEGLGGERCGATGGGGAGGPVGDAHGVGEHRPGLAGQFGAGRGALGGPGGRPGAPGGHRLAGGGEGSRADKSQPGVARGTGRHRSSLASVGPKAQTEGVSPVSARSPGRGEQKGPIPASPHIRGVRKRLSVSS